jgi:hypothetical protein
MIDDFSSSSTSGFLRPAALLGGWTIAIALLLSPIAWTRTGSGGLLGLALAAAVCLGAGWLAEALAFVLHRSVSPLSLMLLGMATRLLPPLAICVALAAQGAAGREHLAFLSYLLTFYFVMLALETWLSVRRVACASSPLNHSAH